MILFVATTIHLPDRVLARVDARAKALGISRNKVILDAVEHALDDRSAWSPELISLLSEPASRGAADALEMSLAAVRKLRRNRRRPVSL
jgi:predicted transcriptional regulator